MYHPRFPRPNQQEIDAIEDEMSLLRRRAEELQRRLTRVRNCEENGWEEHLQLFAVGDKVRILNPKWSQADRGTVTKISLDMITVTTREGRTIRRIPQNLAYDYYASDQPCPLW
jgi:hypothetical protein